MGHVQPGGEGRGEGELFSNVGLMKPGGYTPAASDVRAVARR
jgi:hypothetical protein